VVVSVNSSPFALLDDGNATRGGPVSRLYRGLVREHRCTDPAQLDAIWAQVDADLRAGLHAVVLADYEWGAKLLRAGHAARAAADTSALRVLVFAELALLSRDAVDRWLAALETGASGASGAASVDVGEPGAAGVMGLDASVTRADFGAAIDAIHNAIRAGETYQVNYTFRLHAQAYGSPVALYRRLRARQPVAFGAFIQLPPDDAADATTHVLSRSPELFLRNDGGVLTARPMKGTAPRSDAPEADLAHARALSQDLKNRAENLMIVDLLRNDIGRIAQTGSVSVPDLFAIEPYATVFQMTSTVQARLRPEVAFPELLRAVFPCGSITGAPKHHTMQLIAGLESTPRGLYCGAIGWIAPPVADSASPQVGDFCWSVAIRTVTLGAAQHGLRAARLGIGSGIVLDSEADGEWAECWWKARFLTDVAPGFGLFETMLAEAVASGDHQVKHLARHLDRLAHSAAALGFAFDRQAAQALVDARLHGLLNETTPRYRLKLSLAHGGQLQLAHAPLADLTQVPAGAQQAAAAAAVTLLIAPERLPNTQPLAAFKTTLRQAYDAGVRAAEAVGAFDSVFFTDDGRLVEGGRSSVFVKLDGAWFTPPVADGALPGVMRALVLDDPAWQATTRSLRQADLDRAEALMVCNALRGVLSARLADVRR
jgi:para-aminobenzoate synthetase / 4-amino-4-deoxychorismate lyase